MDNKDLYSIDNLKVFMVKNHLRQQDLADDLNIALCKINQKINGKTKWSLRDLQLFIAKYGIEEASKIFFLK